MDNGGEGALHVDNVDGQPPNLNISDVIEAICKDPLYGAGVEMTRPLPHSGLPYVHIVEQPAWKALRFRYECEGRSAGSIPGVNSKPERRTYPTIEICGYRGPVIIVVSCVTRDEPFKPHPHNLVGRERCENGVCTLKASITDENPHVSFSNLGIQCVKRKDITDALKMREKLKIDPFKTGYSHRNQPQTIDLNAVRLCFQVFVTDDNKKVRHTLQPVVSDIIYDKKAMSDLIITRVSDISGAITGGTELILLCEKVTREDIAVVFFEQQGERVLWEAPATTVLVHKLTAIVFRTPPYRDINVTKQVQVYFQLKRLTDNARSNAIGFEYIPACQGPNYLKHKRQKTLSPTMQVYEDRFTNELVKLEPDKTPPHAAAFSPAACADCADCADSAAPYQWEMPPLGDSHVYRSDAQWAQPYVEVGAAPAPHYQHLQALSPDMANMANMLPMDRISPSHAMSPAMGHVSPNMGHASPSMLHGAALGHVSPGLVMDHIPPNLMHHQMPEQQLMEVPNAGDSASLIRLLQDRGEGMLQLNSGELSGLSSLLDRGQDLSDSLNRLSTNDLFH